MQRRFVLGWMLLCCAWPLHAAAQDTALDRFLAGLGSWRAEFTQTTTDTRGRSRGAEQGRLIVQRPGRFRWETGPVRAAEPAQVMVADGRNLWFFDRDVEQVIDEAQQLVYAVSNKTATRAFNAIRDELTAAWERLESLQKHDDTMRGVPTGFPALDSMLSGFQRSDLIILAARPSMGKTTLGLDIARQTAIKHKTPVGFFSLEMSSQQLVDRMLAAQAGVNSWKLRTGRIKSDEEFERLQHGLEELSEAPIYIDDKSSNTVLTMRSIARRMKSEKGLGLIVIDYLQLITPSIQGSNVSMVQQVTEISRSLKGLARELDVPVLALSQLSRAVESRGGKPRLSDLRDSGSIEQDADVVMFIHREDMMGNRSENEKNNIAEILIEKHRNGPIGKVDLLFDEQSTTFKTVEKADFGDYSQAVVSSAGDPF